MYGDSAYASQKELIASKAPHARDFTNQRTRHNGVIDEVQKAKNRNKSRIRARVEHVFGVVKRLWGFGKVRYRGLQKNATRAFTALALANIYLSRGRLLWQVRPYGPNTGRKTRSQPCRAEAQAANLQIHRQIAVHRQFAGLVQRCLNRNRWQLSYKSGLGRYPGSSSGSSVAHHCQNLHTKAPLVSSIRWHDNTFRTYTRISANKRLSAPTFVPWRRRSALRNLC
ncbi:Transposase, IS4-like [Comamonadaceae bacterium]